MKVSVIFWSGSGNTEAMANAVAEGAREAGADVRLTNVGAAAAADVQEADAVAMGCPTMGAEVLEESEFQPFWDSVKGALGGKKLALFGSYGWGDGEWMRAWQEDAQASGALLVADGVIAMGEPDDNAAQQCRDLGKALVG